MGKRDKLIGIPVFIILISLLIACSKNNNSILKEADEVVRNQPDSALVLLSQIENPYRLEDKEKADYWKIRSLANSLKHNTMTTDSLILYSLHFYQNNRDTVNLLEIYSLAGDYYGDINQPDSAIDLYNAGFDLAEDLKDSARISEFSFKSGITELNRRRNKEAVEYFKRNIRFDPKSHYAYYMAGLFSPEVINDSTQYYIDEAVRLALQQKDTLFAAHYLRNYANALLSEKKDYDKAMELIKRTGELTDFYKNFEANDVIMTEIYIAKGQLDSAQFYLDKAKTEHGQSFIGTPNEYNLIGDINSEGALQVAIDAKRNRDVLNDIGRMGCFNDSIIIVIMNKNKALSEQTAERNRLEQQNLKLLISKQRFQIALITGVFIIILTSIGIYLYGLKRTRKIEEMAEKAESLQRLFREALNVKDEKASNNQLFRKTLLQQLGIIRLVATVPEKQRQQLLHRIIDISNEAVSTESLLKWNDLYSIIDSVYDNFYTKLVRKYGNILIEKEIQLCCLLCANFSTVEISAVMQQSMQTIYQRKSTIREKMNMGNKEDIISFLEDQFSLEI